MDSGICLKRLSSLYYHLGFGFFALGNFKEMSEIFGLFLLLAFGFNSLYSLWFPTTSTQIWRNSRRKPRKSRNAFHWEKIVEAKASRKAERDGNLEAEASALRKLVKMERRRADAACAEVERERSASATAVEEAMAMIQRLQYEKSTMEMEFNQHRRLAEAERARDEEAIKSLEWLVRRCEAELSVLRRELGLFEPIPNLTP